jgi:hypothetical protein
MEVIDSPALPLDQWIGIMEREYFDSFLPAGGAAVKFVIAGEDTAETLLHAIAGVAGRCGMIAARINAGETRLHMLQELFFALARMLPWDDLARRYVEDLFARNDYPWPESGQKLTMAELAQEFEVAPNLLTRGRDQWLSRDLWDDPHLARDFRSAMLHLCLARLEPDGDGAVSPILQWLCGEKILLGQLRQFDIVARITRTNARSMLISVCHWLRKCGISGLVLALDLRPAMPAKAPPDQAVRYSTAAVMDLYEVLRELVDDIENLPGLFVLALADQSLVAGDRRRTLDTYKALEMRIWPDVRPGDRQNPLAPLVTVGA